MNILKDRSGDNVIKRLVGCLFALVVFVAPLTLAAPTSYAASTGDIVEKGLTDLRDTLDSGSSSSQPEQRFGFVDSAKVLNFFVSTSAPLSSLDAGITNEAAGSSLYLVTLKMLGGLSVVGAQYATATLIYLTKILFAPLGSEVGEGIFALLGPAIFLSFTLIIIISVLKGQRQSGSSTFSNELEEIGEALSRASSATIRRSMSPTSIPLGIVKFIFCVLIFLFTVPSKPILNLQGPDSPVRAGEPITSQAQVDAMTPVGYIPPALELIIKTSNILSNTIRLFVDSGADLSPEDYQIYRAFSSVAPAGLSHATEDIFGLNVGSIVRSQGAMLDKRSPYYNSFFDAYLLSSALNFIIQNSPDPKVVDIASHASAMLDSEMPSSPLPWFDAAGETDFMTFLLEGFNDAGGRVSSSQKKINLFSYPENQTPIASSVQFVPVTSERVFNINDAKNESVYAASDIYKFLTEEPGSSVSHLSLARDYAPPPSEPLYLFEDFTAPLLSSYRDLEEVLARGVYSYSGSGLGVIHRAVFNKTFYQGRNGGPSSIGIRAGVTNLKQLMESGYQDFEQTAQFSSAADKVTAGVMKYIAQGLSANLPANKIINGLFTTSPAQLSLLGVSQGSTSVSSVFDTLGDFYMGPRSSLSNIPVYDKPLPEYLSDVVKTNAPSHIGELTPQVLASAIGGAGGLSCLLVPPPAPPQSIPPLHWPFTDEAIAGKKITVTSPLSPARVHPVLGDVRPHKGVDFGAENGIAGVPVIAPADGKIGPIAPGWQDPADHKKGYGQRVYIDHGNGYYTVYAHLSKIVPGLQLGVPVKAGQIIGFVGSTGSSTAPHLHFELRKLVRGSVLQSSLVMDPLGPVDFNINIPTYQPKAVAFSPCFNITPEIADAGGCTEPLHTLNHDPNMNLQCAVKYLGKALDVSSGDLQSALTMISIGYHFNSSSAAASFSEFKGLVEEAPYVAAYPATVNRLHLTLTGQPLPSSPLFASLVASNSLPVISQTVNNTVGSGATSTSTSASHADSLSVAMAAPQLMSDSYIQAQKEFEVRVLNALNKLKKRVLCQAVVASMNRQVGQEFEAPIGVNILTTNPISVLKTVAGNLANDASRVTTSALASTTVKYLVQTVSYPSAAQGKVLEQSGTLPAKLQPNGDYGFLNLSNYPLAYDSLASAAQAMLGSADVRGRTIKAAVTSQLNKCISNTDFDPVVYKLTADGMGIEKDLVNSPTRSSLGEQIASLYETTPADLESSVTPLGVVYEMLSPWGAPSNERLKIVSSSSSIYPVLGLLAVSRAQDGREALNAATSAASVGLNAIKNDSEKGFLHKAYSRLTAWLNGVKERNQKFFKFMKGYGKKISLATKKIKGKLSKLAPASQQAYEYTKMALSIMAAALVGIVIVMFVALLVCQVILSLSVFAIVFLYLASTYWYLALARPDKALVSIFTGGVSIIVLTVVSTLIGDLGTAFIGIFM